MNPEKWENIIFLIEEKFGIKNRYQEEFEVATGLEGNSIKGQKEIIEFSSPLGLIKLEKISRPKIIDKKVLSTKRIGGKVAIDYIYSPEEKTYQFKIYKLNEGQKEWEEINPKLFL